MDARTPKRVMGYYLDERVIEWLAEQARAEKRSASWYLNEMLLAALTRTATRD